MQVLNTFPPDIDPRDVQGSLQKISDYLQRFSENVDFILARELRAKSEAEKMYEQISQLAQQIQNQPEVLPAANTEGGEP